MDKNNDIKVNKVSKWEAAPVSIKNLRNYISESWINYAAPPCCPPLDPSCQDSICESMMTLLESVLDDYNELEAKHQKDAGMISEYEEENKKLRDSNELCMKAHLRLIDESTELASENAELRSECESKEAEIRDLEAQASVNASRHESELKQVIELAKSYGIIIRDERKDAKPDNAINIGMCGYYYVLDEQIKNKYAFLKYRCNELSYRNAKYAWVIKTILKKASYSPGHIAEELRFMARPSTTPKDVFERWEGIADELLGEHSKLVDKINRLEKKNEELSSQVSNLKEKNDKLRVLPICGEIKWVLKEDDV